MQSMLQVLKKMDKIHLELHDSSLYAVVNSTSSEVICEIHVDRQLYRLLAAIDENEDVCRVLDWFKFRNIESLPNNKVNCNGLDCESCSGCSFNTLAALYNSRRVLEKHISEEVLNSYTFIGSLSPHSPDLAVSPYKNYISYKDNSFVLWKPVSDVTKVVWYSESVKDSADCLYERLHIEQFIPEILYVPEGFRELYGTYRNRPVIWHYIDNGYRRKWYYKELAD